MGWSGVLRPRQEAKLARGAKDEEHAMSHKLNSAIAVTEAIAEVVQRPTLKFVATKTAEKLDLQALHRVRERLVSQRTGIIN